MPVEDIRAELRAAPATNGEVAGVLHPGIPFGVHTAAGEPVSIEDREGAGFRLADEDLAGYVVLDFDAFDEWYEEDERIAGHPRDPFHRVDVRRSARPVRIEVDGEVVAETTRARLLFETSLPLRFYLPREDVRVELHPSRGAPTAPTRARRRTGRSTPAGAGARTWPGATSSRCPDAVAITGLVAFWDEQVDVFLDGERRERPGGAMSRRCATSSASSGERVRNRGARPAATRTGRRRWCRCAARGAARWPARGRRRDGWRSRRCRR